MARRSGFTLLELVVVMAILVVVSALTFPLIDGLINPGRLTAARDMVRGNLAEMRGRAMSESRSYRFQVQPNTGKFKIEPTDGNTAQRNNLGSVPWTYEGELPENILFANATSGPSSQAMVGEGGWNTLVIFLPDGSAQDSAAVSFSFEGTRSLVVQVRDLTGAISTPEPGREEVMP